MFDRHNAHVATGQPLQAHRTIPFNLGTLPAVWKSLMTSKDHFKGCKRADLEL